MNIHKHILLINLLNYKQERIQTDILYGMRYKYLVKTKIPIIPTIKNKRNTHNINNREMLYMHNIRVP